MLHDPARHEALAATPWDADQAREAIDHVVRAAERWFETSGWWPLHPRDADDIDKAGEPNYTLYFGAAGVVWALDHLHAVGAAPRRVDFGLPLLQQALERNQAWLRRGATQDESASYLMGDTPLLMMLQGREPTAGRADRLAALIERNIEHPAREILWGAPGTMLAALHLHERFGADDPRWAALFRRSAQRLWSQRLWSDAHGCHYWTQDMYGRCSSYIDAVHGFAGTAYVALRGAYLLPDRDRAAWQDMIVDTVMRTATREDGRASWRTALDVPAGQSPRMLMQYCHGAPGFVINLAGLPTGSALDALLLEAGEATWHAGPLVKGSNLCHGTGGNGYAFLRLWERTGDPMWLDRARAFAMHGIGQMHADEALHGQLRHSLWTGDPGLAIYLWDCLRGRSAFPTLDVFYPAA